MALLRTPTVKILLNVSGLAMWRRGLRQANQSLRETSKQAVQTAADISRLGGVWASSFQELAASSRLFTGEFADMAATNAEFAQHFEALKVAGEEAFNALGEGLRVNVPLFDAAINKGYDLDAAMRLASTGTLDVAKSVNTVAVAYGTLTFALFTVTNAFQGAIQSAIDYQDEVYRLRYQMAATIDEAEGWIAVTKLTGISLSTFERGVTNAQRQLANMQLGFVEDEEEATNFAKSLKYFNISLNDLSKPGGGLISVTELIGLMEREMERTGPNAASTGAAINILGYSARDLVPFLYDTNVSLEDMIQLGEKLNLVSLEDQKRLIEWKLATVDLDLATQQYKNFVARFYLPILKEMVKIITFAINGYRVLWTTMAAGITVLKEVGTRQLDIVYAGQRFVQVYDELRAKMDEATKAEEKNALALSQQSAALQLAEEKYRNYLAAVKDLADERDKKLLESEEDFNKRWDEVLRQRGRDAIIEFIRLAGQLNEMMIRTNEQRADAWKNYQRRLAEIQRDQDKAIEEFEADANKRREDLLQKHLDKIKDIWDDYYWDLQEAVRQNDAVAVLKAMRQRDKELQDEQKRYGREQRDLEENLNDKRKQIAKDADERRQDELRRYQEALDDIEENYQRQLDALERQGEQERMIRKLQYKWEREDWERNKEEAKQDILKWYDEEKAMLEKQNADVIKLAQQGLFDLGEAAAKSTSEAVKKITEAASSEIEAFARRNPEISRIITGLISAGAGSLGISKILGNRDSGGMDVISSPGLVRVGQRGVPELHAWMPLNGSMNVNHSFGQFNMNVNGLGGVNTGQVQAIVWSAMREVARSLVSRRR